MSIFRIFGKRQSTDGVALRGRQDERPRISLDAKIILSPRKVIKCSIANIDGTGAILIVPIVLGLPTEFHLQENSGRTRPVRVLRRGVSGVAVKFV